MVGTLQVKKSPGYTTDEGVAVPEHELYRYVDTDGKGGCWYSTTQMAQKSWERAHPPATEAQAAADDLLTIYGAPKSREALHALLAVAFSRGALAAATEAAEAGKSA